MRRFIAYVGLSVLGLIAVGATFDSTFIQTHTNIEYADGRALTFRLSQTEENSDEELPADAADVIADIMQQRLNTYGETRYDIYTQGNDTVQVVLSEEQTTYYEQIETYLSFNGAFALGTETNTVAIGDEFMDPNKDAYVTFINHYPTVVIPINSESEEFQAVIQEAERLQEEASNSESESDSESQQDTTTYVYLAYNFVEGEDSISQLISTNEDYNEDKADKLLMQFDISRIWSDDEHTAIASSVNIDTDGDGTINVNDVANGTQIANYYVNLLNSEELPYNVTFIFESKVPAYFENIIDYGMRETVAMSRTLIATLFAIVIICLLLAVVYRYATIAIGSISIGVTYIGLLFALLFSVEFNTAMVIGLALVALVSLACGVIYVNKVREECYRGRSLRKANAEGAKRALLPIVDANVLLIIIGAIFYWLGGDMMVSFASVCVFGGIASLILNILLLKGMMWLLTNTTKFNNKYSIIGVKNENVPNLLNEEKQEYYGAFQNTDFTKHKKSMFAIAAVLFISAIAGTFTFGFLNNGIMFNSGDYSSGNTYLYFETTTTNSALNTAYVENLVSNTLLVYDNETAPLISEDSNFNDLASVYTRSETLNGVETTYTYIVVDLQQDIASDHQISLTIDDTTYTGDLNTVYSDYLEESNLDINATVSVKMTHHVNSQQPNWVSIVIASSVAMAFMSLYLMLRYGLSKGLMSFVLVGFSGFVSVGFFALTRITAYMEIMIVLPLVITIGYILILMLINKEKEMVKEEIVRSKENSIEMHEQITKRATSLSAGSILFFGLICAYYAINFFGFGVSATSLYYIFAIIGFIVSIIFTLSIYGYLSFYVYKFERKLNIRLPKLKFKRKHKKVKVKSSEPEEAIFIGIND